MKRLLSSIVLIVCLLAGMIQPVFAAQEETAEPLPTEQAVDGSEIADESESDFPEPTEQELSEPTAEITEQTSDMRTVQTYTTSKEGIAFIDEMMEAVKARISLSLRRKRSTILSNPIS